MIYQTNNPILFITFIKFDTAFSVFEKIKETQPRKLYVSSDGGRNEEEHEKILDFRSKLLKQIDWNCEVYTLFEEKNYGCKYGPYNAISWFFSKEEQGIILEDDCLPDNSFFQFCDELLEKYKNETKIFMISGWSAFNLIHHFDKISREDYFFSKYPHIWGWATWKRAWKEYNINRVNFDFFKEISFDSNREKKYWKNIFLQYQEKNLDAWDYPMLFHILTHNLFCVAPKISMIENIGLNREDATHTKGKSNLQKIKAKKQVFPLTHPTLIKRNISLDKINFKIVFDPGNFFLKFYKKLRFLLFKKQ